MTLDLPPATSLRNASLFLDFDGTLVELAERPDAVRVDAALRELIAALAARLDGRLVLISGRSAGDIRALLDCGNVTVVGSHGMEYAWADGRPHRTERPEGLADALLAMRAVEARVAGVVVEDKPLGVALHFRQAPDAEAECLAMATELADRHGLTLQHGKMMVEVRAGGGDKGTALRTLMAEPSFASTRPLFMGDDLTDEPAFAAAAELGGGGILIGKRQPTAATYALPDVSAARTWLRAACEAIA